APTGEEGEEAPAPDTYVVDIEVQVAVAAQEVAEAALVAGPTAVSGDVVSTIRANEDLASTLSTVSGVEGEPGRINVPLALAARVAGEVGQFGFEESATAVLPPAVELPPRTRTTASDTGTPTSGDADVEQTDADAGEGGRGARAAHAPGRRGLRRGDGGGAPRHGVEPAGRRRAVDAHEPPGRAHQPAGGPGRRGGPRRR